MANWHYIAGYPDYKVSDEGQVFSKKTNRVLKPRIHNGYERVALNKNGKAKDFTIHRLVATAFLIGEPNQNMVNHKDGNRTNNHIQNLEWCTLSENRQHAYDTGLQKGRKGSAHHGARFTNEQVRDIKIRLANGHGVTKISRELGVSHATISLINTGKNWSHIKTDSEV